MRISKQFWVVRLVTAPFPLSTSENRNHHRHEAGIFRRVAFENVSPGGAYTGAGVMMVSVFSESYQLLDSEQKTNIRQWWH